MHGAWRWRSPNCFKQIQANPAFLMPATTFLSIPPFILSDVGCLAAPFPALRLPGLLSSRLYSIVVVYMLLINFCFVGVSYHYFDGCPHVDEVTAWNLLFISTMFCIISGAVTYYYVPNTHKRTFFEHYPLRKHFDSYVWDEAAELVHNGVVISTRDGIRANLGAYSSIYYIPNEKLINLFGEKWRQWELELPDWFDRDFRENVPPHLLVCVPPRFINIKLDRVGDDRYGYVPPHLLVRVPSTILIM